MLTTNTSANAIVQRFRFRSTSEPPPNGPPPAPPIPNAPDRPASLPECSSTRKISTTREKTWKTSRTAYIGAQILAERRPSLRRPALVDQLVDLLQDLDRLAAAARGRARGSPPPTACRCGSRARRRGSRGTWPPCGPRARPAARRSPVDRSPESPAQQRRSTTTATQRSAPRSGGRRASPVLHDTPSSRRSGARELAAEPGGVEARDPPARGERGRPEGDQRAAEHDQAADPDPGHHRVDDHAEGRRRRSLQVALRRAPRSAAPGPRGDASAKRRLASRIGAFSDAQVRLHGGPDVARERRLRGPPRWSTRPGRSARSCPSRHPARGSSCATGRSSATRLPSLRTSSTAPKSSFSFERPEVGRT